LPRETNIACLLNLALQLQEPRASFSVAEIWSVLKDEGFRFVFSKFINNPNDFVEKLTARVMKSSPTTGLRETLTGKARVENIHWLQIRVIDTDAADIALQRVSDRKVCFICCYGKWVHFDGPQRWDANPVKSHAKAADPREQRPGA
jgi:hypothetical protein